jgi:uncharacterized protein
MNKPTLYITAGYPGSGKSYFAERFARDKHIFHLRADALHLAMFDDPNYMPDEHRLVFRTMDFMAEQLLLQGLSVIYDANLNKRIHREQKRQMAARRHAGYQLFWVKTPEELAFKRLSERKGNDADEVTVTPDVFKRFKAELEQPVDETFVEVDGQMPYEEQIKQLERP